jgi:hypothetical protein
MAVVALLPCGKIEAFAREMNSCLKIESDGKLYSFVND